MRRHCIARFVVALCALTLVGCAPPAQLVVPLPTAPPTPTVPTAQGATTPGPTATPGGPAVCPPTLATADLAAALKLDPTVARIERVSCGDLQRDGNREALVTLRHGDTARTLDLAVLSLPAGATPVPLWRLNGLIGGAARISLAETIVIKAIDPLDCVNRAAQRPGQWQPSLALEYGWNGATFAPVVFPGVFPLTDRFDAEAAQTAADVASGAQSPLAVASAFLIGPLGALHPDDHASVTSQDAATAIISAGGFAIQLQRLVRRGDGGLWFVTGVAAQTDLALTAPATGATVSTPITIAGTGATVAATATMPTPPPLSVTLTGHVGCSLGASQIALGATSAAFSGTVAYVADAGLPAGQPQPGIVLVGERGTNGNYLTAGIAPVLLG